MSATHPAPGEDTRPPIAPRVRLDRIEDALAALAAGRPVAVVDDASRENEGDLVLAAQFATPESIAFMIRHTSGVLCAPLPGERLDALGLPPMTAVNQDLKGTAYSISVDAREGITTGISAADRARTLRLLAVPESVTGQFTRPGHVFPLRTAEHGVLSRRGHTEAAVDLTRLAGLSPAGVIGELVADDGFVLDAAGTRGFADRHGLIMVSIADLVAYRYRHDDRLQRGRPAELPVTAARGGTAPFTAIAFTDPATGAEHLALTLGLGADPRKDPAGDPRDRDDAPLVRIHSECLTGDVFGSRRCDCGPQLQQALGLIAEARRGIVVYLRDHEGRGIGLAAKLAAYALQEQGQDTFEANLSLGLPADSRNYQVAATILRHLGVRRVRLLTHNPEKVSALQAGGIEIAERVVSPVAVTAENLRYLRTKRDRAGHDLRLPGDSERVPGSPLLGTCS